MKFKTPKGKYKISGHIHYVDGKQVDFERMATEAEAEALDSTELNHPKKRGLHTIFRNDFIQFVLLYVLFFLFVVIGTVLCVGFPIE